MIGCAEGLPLSAENGVPTPELSGVQPAFGYSGNDTDIVIHGRNLEPRVIQSLEAVGGVNLDVAFSATLADRSLSGVTWIDNRQLRARVPAGLPSQLYSIIVTTPNGERVTLEDAFFVSDIAPPSLQALDPAVVINDDTSDVVVLGSSIQPESVIALHGPETFELSLFEQAGEQRAFRLPIGAPPGTYAATITNADGASDELRDALTVLGPAALAVEVEELPERVNVGQELNASIEVRNLGASAALGVTLGAPVTSGTGVFEVVGVTPVSAPVILAGESAHFQVRLRGVAAGLAGLAWGASGVNDRSERPASSPTSASTSSLVEIPAQLQAEVLGTAHSGVGSPRDMVVRVFNRGGATSLAVRPHDLIFAPAARITVDSETSPEEADIPGNSFLDFAFVVRGRTSGTVTLATGASGTDANDGGQLTTSAQSSFEIFDINILTPSIAAAPARLTLGAHTEVTVTVTNTSALDAMDVVPVLGIDLGAAAEISAPTPPSAAVPAGASASFRFQVTPEAAGRLTLDASAHGVETTTSASLGGPKAFLSVDTDAPPSLSLSLDIPSEVTVGQAVQVTATVTNTGGAGVDTVRPSLDSGGALTCGAPTPSSASVAGGESVVFTFQCTVGSSDGSAQVGLSVTGQDANLGTAVSATQPTPVPIELQQPAALSLGIAVPAAVSVGQAYAATVTVTNSGGALASEVEVQLSTQSAPGTGCVQISPSGSLSVASGASADVVYTCHVATSGTAALTATARGVERNSGDPVVSAPVTSASILNQRPPSFGFSWTVPGQLAFGQGFDATLEVTNTGEATADDVIAGTPQVLTGTGTLCLPTTDPPLLLASGAKGAFRFSCVAGDGVVGPVDLRTVVSATDDNTQAPIAPATAVAPPIEVVGAARLVVQWTVPAAVEPGASFVIQLRATNAGDTEILDAAPEDVQIANLPGTLCGGGQPAPVNIPVGGDVTFTFSCDAGTEALGSFSTRVLGTDGVSGLPVESLALSSSALKVFLPPAALNASIVAPSHVSIGKSFNVIVTLSNTGAVDLLDVSPEGFAPSSGTVSCAGASPASAAVAQATSAAFAISCTAESELSVTFSSRGSARDPRNDDTVSSSIATSSAAIVQRAPRLVASWQSVPTHVSFGQVWNAAVRVTNTGTATAQSVTPGPAVLSGGTGSSCGPASPASAQVAGGAFRDFNYLCTTGTTSGNLALTVDPSGTDANSGQATVSVAATSATTTVQSPASLSAQLSAPAYVIVGTTFDVAVTVTNTGQAVAQAVTLENVQLTGATGTACPSFMPLTGTVAGGGSAVFTLRCDVGSVSSTLSVAARARGTDVNSGDSVTSPTGSTSLFHSGGDFRINEIVVNPRHDWNESAGGNGVKFDHIPGTGVVDVQDQWLEIVNIGAAAVSLAGYRLVIIDSVTDGLTLGTAGGHSLRFSDGGSVGNFLPGEHLVIGNAGAPSGLENFGRLELLTPSGLVLDEMEFGTTNLGDGNGLNNAPPGTSSFGADAIARKLDGEDTNGDAIDFAKQRSTIGRDNACATTAAVTVDEDTVASLIGRTSSKSLRLPAVEVTAADDRVLLVTFVAQDGLDANKTVVRYGSVALQRVRDPRDPSIELAYENSEFHLEVWALANPPVGSADVVITLAADKDIAAVARTVRGVRQADIIDAANLATGDSITFGASLTTFEPGSVVMSDVAHKRDRDLASVSAPAVLAWLLDNNVRDAAGAGAITDVAAPSIVTTTFTLSSKGKWIEAMWALAPQCQ